MKKILVTGGAGFIGSHTVVALCENGFYPIIMDDLRNAEDWIIEEIKSLCDNQLSFYPYDCSNKKLLNEILQAEEKIDGVIHFAADKAVGESVENPIKYYKNNINSLVVLLEFIEEHDINNFVFSSSCTVYGQPKSTPVDEQFPIQIPESPYGFTKLADEQLLKYMHDAKRIDNAILLRYFNPIGAHPSGKIGELPLGVPNNLVPYVTQTAAKIRTELKVFGNDYNTVDGTCIRDYLHVCDLAQAHVDALGFVLENPKKFEIFNLGMGKGVSVLEIIRNFEEVTGVKLNWSFGPRRAGDVEQIYADASKANEVLQWKCKYSIKDALEHAWLWQKNISNLAQ